MSEWRTVRIGQAGKVVTGSTPSPAIAQYWDGDVPFITPADISDSAYVRSTERRLSTLGTSVARLIPANSVMVTCIGSTIGKTAYPLVESVTNQQINTVIPCDFANPRFLYYTLLRLADSIKQIAGVTAVPIVNKTDFSQIEFLLPPLPQQRKIARILTTVDNLIEKTEALIAKYQAIKQGMMHDLFTRGVDEHGHLRPPYEEAPEHYKQSELGWIPKEWEVSLLDNVAIRGSGHTPNKLIGAYWNGGIKWVSLADSDKLDRLFISETDKNISKLGLANSSAVRHRPGTVILSRDAGVGKSAIISEVMAVSQHFMAWFCGPRLVNYFLYYWLQHKKPVFEAIAMGSTIKTIGLSYFKKLQIAAPPVQEQTVGSNAVLAAERRIVGLTEELANYKQQKIGLMQDLLTGKVLAKVDEAEEVTAYA